MFGKVRCFAIWVFDYLNKSNDTNLVKLAHVQMHEYKSQHLYTVWVVQILNKQGT